MTYKHIVYIKSIRNRWKVFQRVNFEIVSAGQRVAQSKILQDSINQREHQSIKAGFEFTEYKKAVINNKMIRCI